MPIYDLRILLETIEGKKTSYYSSGSSFLPNSFINTAVDGNFMSASMVRDRVRRMVSASYQNETIFTGEVVNGAAGSSNYFGKNTNLISASLSGSQNTGSIVFTALDTEYDRLLRYKFIGEKVTNTLGLPSDQWIYVDQVRLPSDDEANIFQGNANLGNVSISDTLTFAGGSDVNSDVPILIDTGSDRYIKFVDERGISEVALRMGYDKDTDTYEISGSDDFTVNIGGVDKADITSMNGNITASGFIFSKDTDGGNSIITIENSNTDTGTDKGAGIEFKHKDNTGGGAISQPAGAIIAGKDSNYGAAGGVSSKDSNLQFFTTLNGTDTERLRIDSNGLAIFTGDISASGNLTIEGSIQATQITSSIVSSSIIFSSGSNIFGDEIGDSHTFNGHITASGNISASGGAFLGFGTATSTNDTKTDAAIVIPANKAIYTLDSSGQYLRNLIKKNSDVIQIGQSGTGLVDEIRLLPGSTGFTTFYGNTTEVARVDVAGNITASGNISSSLTSTGSLGRGEFQDFITVGDSSATSTGILVEASDSDTFYDGLEIKRKFPRIALTDTVGTDNTFHIWHLGDQLRFGSDAGGELNSVLTMETGTAADAFFNGKLGIGKKDATKQLEVAGDISSSGAINTLSHITASGNISASLTSTGSFGHIKIPDGSGGIHLGSSNDLQIYHNGSNSYIQDTGTGKLILDTNGTDVRITKTDSEFMAKFVTDGAVELYHNHVKKFETTTTGIDVIGNISASSHITASGNISASGDLIVSDINVDGDIIHTGDTDTKIALTDDTITFKAGDVEMIRLVQGSNNSVVVNDLSADIDFRVESNNNVNMLRVVGGTDTVGIGTGTPSQTLTVEGDISASGYLSTESHITASGNISSSGVGTFASLDISGDIDVDGTTNLDNIDVDGTANFADNITIAENKAIFFDSTDTFIKANTGAAEDLVISADEDIILAPDDNIQIEHGATIYAEFMGDERKLSITGEISASAGVTTSHITASGNISSSGTIFAGTLDADAVTDGLAAVIVAEIDNDEIPIAKLAEDAVTVTAGTGLTGGGAITLGGSATVNVIGGDGITANANDMAITAAQTTIESILKADLVIGEDDETKIDFETADEIHFDVNNVELLNLTGTKISGSLISTGSFGNIIGTSIELPNDSISGDVVEGGTIASITISELGGALDANNQNITNIDVDSGVIDGTVIGGNSAAAGTFTTINATSLNVTNITSSIVTSSILQTEGSNIFGDASTDTHTFNGHITASNNISASGTIKAATLDADAITDGLAGVIVAEIDNDEIPIAKLAEDAVTVTAGTGLTGGGSITLGGSATVNVIGGDGITANANDVAITAAQTTIESILKEDLVIGEDAQTKIDFETADEIHFYANNAQEMIVQANVVAPGADDGTALGDANQRWSDLFLAEGGVINFDNGDVTLTQTADNLTIAGGSISASGDLRVTGNISGSGTGSFGEINLDDNKKIKLGTDDDLEIFHDGSNSNISDSGTGALNINGSVVRVRDKSDGNTLAEFTDGAGTLLKHNNSTKFKTSTTGISVTGNISASSHITASGNISSSGTIKAATLDADAVTDGLAAAIVAEIDNDEIPIAKLAEDAVTVTAGTGLTGGGSITLGGSATVNVIGGDGITANANDVAITAAQTTITSIFATDLKIGEDDETKIDFETADEIHFYANNAQEMVIQANVVAPGADNGTALGDADQRWSDLFLASGGVINFNNGDATITGDGDNLDLVHNQSNFEGGMRISTLGHIQFATVHDGGLNFGTDTRMMISMSGANGTAKVGIGTIVPPEELTVQGNISASGNLNIQGSITATSITSSFVTSSVVLTEGSTVFGDASTDTHKFIGNITASGNISASGTIFAGTLDANAITDGLAGVIVAEIDNDEIPIAKLASDSVTYTAGSGMTGGGEVTLGSSATINVIGGDGITANANDMAITAAQTTIESILKEDLVIGEDAQTKIDFETADEIHFYANNAQEMIVQANVVAPGADDGTALGDANQRWSDLFLAEGAVINFDNGDVTMTQTGNNLAIAGGSISASGDLRVTGNISASGTGSFEMVGIGVLSPTTELEVWSANEQAYHYPLIVRNPYNNNTPSINYGVGMRFHLDDASEAKFGAISYEANTAFGNNGYLRFYVDGNGLTTSPSSSQAQFSINSSGDITASGEISSSGTITSKVFNAIQGGNASAQGLRFDNTTHTGLFGHGNFASLMAAESVTIHIDSNNNGTAEYFNVVKDQKLVGQTTNELFRVQEDGNVGIGTSSPTELLQVAGNISASGVLKADGGISSSANIQIQGDYSGSADSTFVIGGKLQAGSKSFLIDKPEGGKLEYGVLEGPQNDVFHRGELKGDNVIYLPQEWEWLVDENTITTQLTSIGKHQELYFKEIKDNKVFIGINGIFKTKENIHCYYIVHGTRKDIELIRNHQ